MLYSGLLNCRTVLRCAMLWNTVQVPDGVYDSELSRFQSLLGSLRAAGGMHLAQELEDASPLKQVVSCLRSYADLPIKPI